MEMLRPFIRTENTGREVAWGSQAGWLLSQTCWVGGANANSDSLCFLLKPYLEFLNWLLSMFSPF